MQCTTDDFYLSTCLFVLDDPVASQLLMKIPGVSKPDTSPKPQSKRRGRGTNSLKNTVKFQGHQTLF